MAKTRMSAQGEGQTVASSVHEVIEAFRLEPTNSERGTKFEQLMVRYFELDPTMRQQYDAVWRWIDWPGRNGKPDTGIDLVARERDSGELTAIQCKFYEPTHQLAKADIDSFFTASGKEPFTNRIIISTTDRWGSNAEEALEGQTKPVQRIGMAEIAESPIDWTVAWPDGELAVSAAEAKRHEPLPHQQTAIDKVFDKFDAGNDRGKLIMACGTGKTFTALKIAERTVDERGGHARILFCVPSISLLSQTLREWTAQTQHDLRAFAVCSDTKVSRSAEDINVHDVSIPVTTKADRLVEEMAHRKRAKGLTVVFSTYQSLPVVADAQASGVDPFDLIICDEAHRTTGVTVAGDDESNFVRVHDNDYVRASRRLYMTATPRIFDEKTKGKAAEHSAEITSMDDESVYGPEFHRLSFGEAVGIGRLTDYKVLVLTIDQSLIAPQLQGQLAGDNHELTLDDASRIVGCWNGLAKRAGSSVEGVGFEPGDAPMKRAVAFAKDIAASKKVAAMFPRVVDAYRDVLDDDDEVGAGNADLTCEVHHVDGTFNALARNAELAWLKAPMAENDCRILTNARCLSEGIDVPALDAVLFLHPRNSVVDVVQSVGRVMRVSEGKKYGYIILPVAVPADVEPSEALSDNKRFKVVWQVLNALRAHDERFDAEVNSISLNSSKDSQKLGKGSDTLLGGHIGPAGEPVERLASGDDDSGEQPNSADSEFARQMTLFSLSEWREAIFARIVDKVGTRTYWEDWAGSVADIAAAQITRINATLDAGDPSITEQFEKFLAGLRDNLNDSISADDAISMLSQHLITKPVFDALFTEHDFASHNPVSRVMQAMVDALDDTGLNDETAELQGFYESVQVRASQVASADGKQQVIADLYEKFFKVGFAKQAEALGIVYTPVQVVDWILNATDHVSREHFGRGLTDENVHILDGFTGTGTFITRLMQTGVVTSADLARKYANELHANEIMLLAYYVAAVNIEATYHALAGKSAADVYEPFPGIVLTDTFQISEADDTMDAEMFPANNDRITRQLATKVQVVVGNPPYSVGQGSANDNNANVKYPTLDGKIEATYAARSTATNKNSLYDSYIRAFRWATDRIGDQGIVSFVSNGGWIDGNTADGMRLALADDYSAIYVYNLRGNMRKSNWREEGGQVFGAGSQATVAIFIGVKDPRMAGPCQVRYRAVDDCLSRDDKLRILDSDPLTGIDWLEVTPNPHGDWIDQRDEGFGDYPAVGAKKPLPGEVTIFGTLSAGLQTNRDSWVYNYSRSALTQTVSRLVDTYNTEVDLFHTYCELQGITNPNETTTTRYLTETPSAADSTRIKWSSSLKQQLARGVRASFEPDRIVAGQYRPFDTEHV